VFGCINWLRPATQRHHMFHDIFRLALSGWRCQAGSVQLAVFVVTRQHQADYCTMTDTYHNLGIRHVGISNPAALRLSSQKCSRCITWCLPCINRVPARLQLTLCEHKRMPVCSRLMRVCTWRKVQQLQELVVCCHTVLGGSTAVALFGMLCTCCPAFALVLRGRP
jgi:hypothetical protein